MISEILSEKKCVKCGSKNTTRNEYSFKSFDDRDVKGELQQVQITEHSIEKLCNDCNHLEIEAF
jgi:hypothetical protein